MMPSATLDEMLDNQALVRRYGPVSFLIGGSRGGGEGEGGCNFQHHPTLIPYPFVFSNIPFLKNVCMNPRLV